MGNENLLKILAQGAMLKGEGGYGESDLDYDEEGNDPYEDDDDEEDMDADIEAAENDLEDEEADLNIDEKTRMLLQQPIQNEFMNAGGLDDESDDGLELGGNAVMPQFNPMTGDLGEMIPNHPSAYL